MQANSRGVFISWLPFQRRSETVSEALNLELRYFHYNWEEKHKILKAASYIFKFISTLSYLFLKKPKLVVVQLPPTPPLYAVALYAALTNSHYVSDCHNTMIYGGHWIKWPFAKLFLKRSALVLVHNTEVKLMAAARGIKSFIYMDPPPVIKVKPDIHTIAGIKIREENYVLLPCNMAADDEPAEEFFKAARLLPHQAFVLTGYKEKVPVHIRKMAPENVRYTGYLCEDEFNALYKNAAVAVVLSTRIGTQPSGASEAIAAGVPLVVSDMETTRTIYKDTVIFTRNLAPDIAANIQEVLHNKAIYQQKISEIKKQLALQTNLQYQDLVVQLASLGRMQLTGESVSNA